MLMMIDSSIVISGLRTQSTLDISFEDFTYTSALGFIWSQIEPGIALIVASCLLLRPVFDKFFPKVFLSRDSVRRTKEKADSVRNVYPLRDISQGTANCTAFAGTASDSELPIKDNGAPPKWPYHMMDEEHNDAHDSEGIRVDTQWTVQSQGRPQGI